MAANCGWNAINHARRALNPNVTLMHVCADRVDLSQLSEDRNIWPQGCGGTDPRDATTEHGRKYLEKAVAMVAAMFKETGL